MSPPVISRAARDALAKPVHDDDVVYAARIAENVRALLALGMTAEAVSLIVRELRLARTLGEIDGEAMGRLQQRGAA